MDKPKNKRKRNIWLCFLAAIGASFAIPILHKQFKPSAEEQFQAIEASRVIPDDDNAAIQYKRIFESYPGPWEPNTVSKDEMLTTGKQPWLSSDYPEIASWIESHKKIIEQLRIASDIEKCVFPLPHPNKNLVKEGQEPWYAVFRRWILLLRSGAYNDLAEGNKAKAIDKIQILNRLAEHARQQPTRMAFLVYISCEAIAMNLETIFIISSDVNNDDLAFLKSNIQSCLFGKGVKLKNISSAGW